MDAVTALLGSQKESLTNEQLENLQDKINNIKTKEDQS